MQGSCLHDVLGIRRAASNDLQADVEDQENPADDESESSRADQAANAESAGSFLHSFGQYASEGTPSTLVALGIQLTNFPLPISSGAYNERC